jgi:GTPase SAR1 family protein
MHTKFSKGAGGALLFFDISDYSSFKDLENWIKTIKDSAGDIPIILFGIVSDPEHQMVTKEEIYEFLEENRLDSVFFSSIKTEDNAQKKKTVFKRFIQKIAPDFKDIEDFYISFPLEDNEFREFVEQFSICPICKEENHILNLKTLFFSTDPNLEKTRNSLLDLIDDMTNFQTYNSHNISFGIPCCKCFKKLDF